MGEDPNPANYDYDMWAETMNVNLFAPTKLTGHLVPMLKRSKNAKVVMMSSGIASLGIHGKQVDMPIKQVRLR